MYALLDTLRNGAVVDWSYWKNREVKSLCKFAIEIKRCKERDDILDQYTEFAQYVNEIDIHKNKMLSELVNTSRRLKKYLQIHSVFKIDANTEGDWLNKEMIKILNVTDEDIKSINQKEFVPQNIIKKLEIFDPEPIGLEVDHIRIEYDFWGFGGPIRVIDTDWENINKSTPNIEEFLSQYKHVEIMLPSSYSREELLELDDIPF